MTNTKHTSGPWGVGRYWDGNVTPHIEMVMVTAPKSKNFVKEICSFPAKGKGRANAALIAAAPQLLEALIELKACAGELGSPRKCNAMAKARAAVNKATSTEE